MIFSLKSRLQKLSNQIGKQIAGIPVIDSLGHLWLSCKGGPRPLTREQLEKTEMIPTQLHIARVENPQAQASRQRELERELRAEITAGFGVTK